jgi:hypothetical protein
VKDNIFHPRRLRPEEAVTFAPNGHDLVFTGNTFQNKPATIVVDPTCTAAPSQELLLRVVQSRSGRPKTVKKPVDFNHDGRR